MKTTLLGLSAVALLTGVPHARPAEVVSPGPAKNSAPLSQSLPAKTAAPRNVGGIMDNSFLVEEAYNQEAGVVQHIFNGIYGVNKLGGSDDKGLDLIFTQEWPVFSQTHQFSYTIPYHFLESGDQSDNGLGDILLNYRYQAYLNEDTLTAFAPRLSLILPTGDEDQGLGDNTTGFQGNLPLSTTLSDRWFLHGNAGLTYLPNAGTGARHDLLHYHVGSSAIFAPSPDLHFMLEWIGIWNQRYDPSSGRDREFESVISPGVRKAFNFGDETQLVLGLGVPIGLTGSAPDIGVFLYLSFEHGFLKKK